MVLTRSHFQMCISMVWTKKDHTNRPRKSRRQVITDDTIPSQQYDLAARPHLFPLTTSNNRKDQYLTMLKLFLRFSHTQKLVLGFFLVIAVVATVLAFIVDNTVLVIGLFWLLAAAVFVMIMLIRRLNARMTRMYRSYGTPVKKNSGKRPSRLTSDKTLETLQRKFRHDKSAQIALPLAKKLLQEKGNISEANRVLREMPIDTSLQNDELAFVRRAKSLKKYLDQGFKLPHRHSSYNYEPKRNKILYAVGMSPVNMNNGYTSRTHGIATGLASQGAKVMVAPLPGKPWDKSPLPGFSVPSDRRRHLSKINGVQYSHNPGLRAWEGDLDIFLQVSADTYVREAMIEKPEFILAASNYLSALPALMAARRLGVPFVYEMRGFWEVSAASVNPGWEKTDQYKLDRKFEIFVAQEADRVVVITEEMRENLIGRGIAKNKIFVAPNCVDTTKFVPLGKDLALLKKIAFARPELPVVGFAGSVTSYEGVDHVALALSSLKKKGQQFNFLVLGAGKFLSELKTLVSKLGLEDSTRFVDGVASEEMPVYLSSIDIFPLARKSLPVTELVSPIKPLEAMSVGGAVLLSDVSPHVAYYEGHDQRALSFKKDDISSLEEQLQTMLEASPDERLTMGIHARNWIKEHRQWSNAGAALKRVVDSIRNQLVSEQELEQELPLKSYTVAFIGDTFTSDTFIPELNAIQILPENWRKIYEQQNIDALFIESAWMGNDGAWHGIVGYYSDETNAPLAELIKHSRNLGIPVLFWNKEDPVHFNRFKKTASMCDYVFTTDARTIVDYNQQPGNVIKTVASAPFAAQPLLHNPLPSTREKNEDIAYGGTYYGDKYATRKQGLDFLFYESAPFGLSIYERIHNDPNSPYRLPERFKRYAMPSLSYPEMCQAYKAHPIHLNGNSVTESPSMFSRRVVEISASGASVLSSPGRGVDETLAGTVPTVDTPDEANRVLRVWKESEQQRHHQVWSALRHVFEAHTCAHRLTYMFRVAGLRVRSPQRPKLAVECTSDDIQLFERQTTRPDMYLVTDTQEVVFSRVPVIKVAASQRAKELRAHSISYVIRAHQGLKMLDEHSLQDLVGALQFGDWKAVGKRNVHWKIGDPYVPIAALTTDINDEITLYDLDSYERIADGEQLSLTDEDVFAWQIVNDSVVEQAEHERKVSVDETPKLTVLLAGHDFKFFTEIRNIIEQAGHEVIIDHWENHNSHDEDQSLEKLAQADVIFCEWSLGNVSWYSHNKLPGQRLISRFHAQELRTRYLHETNIANVDTFVFVSPTGMRRAQVLFGIPDEKCIVVGNTFNFNNLDITRDEINPKVLGLVGSVPQSKRLDRALDIVEGLRIKDPEFHLVILGKEYPEFPWLQAREEEMAYFEAQYQRISESSHLKDGVTFAGHTSDIARWYTSVPGFILSTSDNEGTHQAIAEGGAAGCVPMIFPWAGAESVYGNRWLVESATDAIDRIQRLASAPQQFMFESHKARDYMRQNFSPEIIGIRILELIEK